MTEEHARLNNEAERGLPDGLGSENTQPGASMTHAIQPDSLVFGLGSAETQHDVRDHGHVAIDHSTMLTTADSRSVWAPRTPRTARRFCTRRGTPWSSAWAQHALVS